MQGRWFFTCCFSWTFGSSSKCGQLKPFLYVLLWWMFFGTGSTGFTSFFLRQVYFCYSDRLHDFSVTIPKCYKHVYVNRFFPCIAMLWNSLPIECFLLTYNLHVFKSRINRHLLTVGSERDFLYTLIFLCFFFL